MKQEYVINMIIKTISIIEKGIEEQCDSSEVKRRIKDEIGYDYIYLSELFKSILGCSLAHYIRMEFYRNACSIWKKEKPILTQRESYAGLDYFLFNFKRFFGMSINEAEMKGFEIMENVTKEELVKMTEILEESAFIESYEFDKGNVNISIDIDMILVFMMSHKSYQIPKMLIEKSNWKSLSEDAKRLFLVLTNRTLNESGEKKEFSINVEDLEYELIVLEAYNIDTPILFNEYYIFYYKVDEQLKPVFERNIDCLFSRMEILIPGRKIPGEYEKLIQAVKECNGLVTVNRIALKCKMSAGDVVDILWEMTKKGFLRIA